MKTAITLEKFEGPLDLLLELIEKEKLPITEIALSEVTEQYITYLDTLEERHPDEIADFLVVASKLVYLKSKTLLPFLYQTEEVEGPSLAEQLMLYKRYIEASKKLNILWLQNNISYGRVEPPIKLEKLFIPENATSTSLQNSFLNLLKRLRPVDPLPKVSIDRSLSVKERIVSIYETLKQLRQCTFDYFIDSVHNRTELVINFLAILELVKTEKIFVKQPNSFEQLTISIIT